MAFKQYSGGSRRAGSWLIGLGAPSGLKVSDQTDDDTADFKRPASLFQDDRLQGRVGRSELYETPGLIEALHRCLTVDDGHDRLTIYSGGLTLDDQDVPVPHAVFDHAVPPHPQSEILSAAEEDAWDPETVASLDGFEGIARRHCPRERNRSGWESVLHQHAGSRLCLQVHGVSSNRDG